MYSTGEREHNHHCLLLFFVFAGLKVDRMSIGWTMILKDDSGVTGWTWRVGNYLLLSISLIGMQVRSDLEFPKDGHYVWKMGKCVVYDVYSCDMEIFTIDLFLMALL